MIGAIRPLYGLLGVAAVSVVGFIFYVQYTALSEARVRQRVSIVRKRLLQSELRMKNSTKPQQPQRQEYDLQTVTGNYTDADVRLVLRGDGEYILCLNPSDPREQQVYARMMSTSESAHLYKYDPTNGTESSGLIMLHGTY